MGAPIPVTLGQKSTIKPAGLISPGIFETDSVILPSAANATTAYFSRAGLPQSALQIDQYVSFDGGQTWDYAGGMRIDGGVYKNRFGQIVNEATISIPGIPDEKGQARLHKIAITAIEAHDITVGIKADQVDPKSVLAAALAGMQ